MSLPQKGAMDQDYRELYTFFCLKNILCFVEQARTEGGPIHGFGDILRSLLQSVRHCVEESMKILI